MEDLICKTLPTNSKLFAGPPSAHAKNFLQIEGAGSGADYNTTHVAICFGNAQTYNTDKHI